MLELKTYSTKELCEELNIKRTTFKTHKNKYLSDYEYVEIKKGRNKFYQIIGYKKNNKAKSEFIQICEKIAGKEVKFPIEDIAEEIIKFLWQEDRTILSATEIGLYIGLDRRTVNKYLKLFREYNILDKQHPVLKRTKIDAETGEVISRRFDPNEYVYYKVYNRIGKREKISKEEYVEMMSFVRKKYSEYMNEYLEICGDNKETINLCSKEAKKQAYKDCIEEFGGIPKKTLPKILTEQAHELFSEYFKEYKLETEEYKLETDNKEYEIDNEKLEIDNEKLEIDNKQLEINNKEPKTTNKLFEPGNKNLEIDDKKLEAANKKYKPEVITIKINVKNWEKMNGIRKSSIV